MKTFAKSLDVLWFKIKWHPKLKCRRIFGGNFFVVFFSGKLGRNLGKNGA